MISLFDGQLTDILPENLKNDLEVKCLSYALKNGLKIVEEYMKRVFIFSAVDTLPEDILNLYAAELRTQYYDQNLDIDKKRTLVKNSLIWYMTAGTPGAVEELVAAVFGEGEVQEWFEYGGEPFYFKINSSAPLEDSSVEFFEKMIHSVKNVRSILEGLDFYRSLESDECMAGAVGQCAIVNIEWEG